MAWAVAESFKTERTLQKILDGEGAYKTAIAQSHAAVAPSNYCLASTCKSENAYHRFEVTESTYHEFEDTEVKGAEFEETEEGTAQGDECDDTLDASGVRPPISAHRLLNLKATHKEVLEDVNQTLSKLLPGDPEIALLIQQTRQNNTSPVYPDFALNKLRSWPSTRSSFDDWWQKGREAGQAGRPGQV